MPTRSPLVLLVAGAAAVAVVVAVAALVAGVPWWLVVVVAPLVGAVPALVVHRRATRRVLDLLGARPLDPDDAPRLANIVDGLCIGHGYRMPRLAVVDSPAIDCALVGHGPGDAHLVVTTGLLSGLERLEIEAVVARGLVILREHMGRATELAAVAALLGRGERAGRLVRAFCDPRPVFDADIDGVGLTRYPPALASAFAKADAAGPPPGPPSTRHLWLIGGDDELRPPLETRIDVLREL